jgi:hypothetical protein
VKSENLEKCDPCVSCQKLEATRLKAFWEGRAAEKEATGNAIDVLRKDRDNFQFLIVSGIPGWKIIEERMRPLSEVAKCYIQVAPEKLLMSQEARRVVEYLDIRNGPMDLRGIFEDCDLGQGKLLDALAEASDVGKIRLVDGKYQIVRD